MGILKHLLKQKYMVTVDHYLVEKALAVVMLWLQRGQGAEAELWKGHSEVTVAETMVWWYRCYRERWASIWTLCPSYFVRSVRCRVLATDPSLVFNKRQSKEREQWDRRVDSTWTSRTRSSQWRWRKKAMVGESVSEEGEGRYSAFPQSGVRREPYPRLTENEINGSIYPEVNLSSYSEYEKMSRLLECCQLRRQRAVENNYFERYVEMEQEISRIERLLVTADDFRPGEVG